MYTSQNVVTVKKTNHTSGTYNQKDPVVQRPPFIVSRPHHSQSGVNVQTKQSKRLSVSHAASGPKNGTTTHAANTSKNGLKSIKVVLLFLMLLSFYDYHILMIVI